MTKIDDSYNPKPVSALAASSSSGRNMSLDMDDERTPFALANSSINHDVPPPFSPYSAEYLEDELGNIISYDPHLSEDGEALYQFLLSKCSTKPSIYITVKGDHKEKNKWVWITRSERDEQGHEVQKTTASEHEQVVLDFDFRIDLTPFLLPQPTHYIYEDTRPAFRGGLSKECFDINGYRRVASSGAIKHAESWAAQRASYGIPTWVNAPPRSEWGFEDDVERYLLSNPEPSNGSKTLREWADEYCASDKQLKEFMYSLIPYGWNLERIKRAVIDTIRSTPYNGTLTVNTLVRGSLITVRPPNRLSRTRSASDFMQFLMCLFLITPFVYLYKHFSAYGGAVWNIGGAGYAFKRWVRVRDSKPNESVDQYIARQNPDVPHTPESDKKRFRRTDEGLFHLEGTREGEWFKRWEGSIKKAIRDQVKNQTFIRERDGRSAAELLDGYEEPN